MGKGLHLFLLASTGFALLVAYAICGVIGLLVQIPHIDIPFHLAGGAWMGWAVYQLYASKYSARPIFTTLLLVLLAAVAWETGEWLVQSGEHDPTHVFTLSLIHI